MPSFTFFYVFLYIFASLGSGNGSHVKFWEENWIGLTKIVGDLSVERNFPTSIIQLQYIAHLPQFL